MAAKITRDDLRSLGLYVERQELCKLLRVSRLTLWRRERMGLIMPIPMNGRVYYRSEGVRNLLIDIGGDCYKLDRVGKPGPKPTSRCRKLGPKVGQKRGRKSTQPFQTYLS